MSLITLRDGLGNAFAVAAETSAGVLTPHSVPEVGGVAVSSTNALPVTPVVGAPTSRSVTTVAAVSTQLIPGNTARKQFWFQAPQTAGVWINRLGGTAGPNLLDCTYWPAGAYYETGSAVTTSAVTYYCASAGLMLAAGEI